MLFGLIVVALGVLLLLSQLMSVSFWLLFSKYWPIALIAYGILRLFKRNKSKVYSLIIILIGVIVQLNALGLFTGNSWVVFLALLLILMGLRIIFEASSPQGRKIHSMDSDGTEAFSYTEGRKTHKASFEQKDVLNDRFVFTSDRRIYKSNTFSGGFVEAIFSKVDIDLKNVWPLEEEIHLDCRANFSTLTIDVPADWHVVVNGKHYYSKNEVEFDQKPTATLIVDSQVFAGSLRIV